MGKLEDRSVINHFSHEHPLKLKQLHSQISSKTTCPACNQSVCGSPVYSCVSCNFHLHKTCSNLPRTLNHKSDQQHDLALLSSPAYPEGVFKCNACGSQGKGFSYHCPDCQVDLHVDCASMPLTINHVTHAHSLSLCFKPPYENQAGFSCDICKQPGSNQWLYRCSLCDFDAHLKCANKAGSTTTTSRSVLPKSTSLPHNSSRPPPSPTPAPPPVQIYYSLPSQYPQVLLKSTSLPSYETHHFSSTPQYQTPPPHSQPVYYSQPAPQYQHHQAQVSHYQATPTMGVQYAQPSRQTGFVNNMAGHAVEGLVGSVAQELIEAVFEGMTS